jgi:hypothetical protein
MRRSRGWGRCLATFPLPKHLHSIKRIRHTCKCPTYAVIHKNWVQISHSLLHVSVKTCQSWSFRGLHPLDPHYMLKAVPAFGPLTPHSLKSKLDLHLVSLWLKNWPAGHYTYNQSIMLIAFYYNVLHYPTLYSECPTTGVLDLLELILYLSNNWNRHAF